MKGIAGPIEQPLAGEWPTPCKIVTIRVVSGELLIDHWYRDKKRLVAGDFYLFHGTPVEVHVSSRYGATYEWETF